VSLRRLAIVPARGGSKRILDKNIRNFCGRPMIAYILETARKSELFNMIHVSTESPQVASAIESLGFPAHFPRPIELADDNTPIMPVLRYVTETFQARGQIFDEVWLLMACAPLIEVSDLQQAAQLLSRLGQSRAVLAVSHFPAPIEKAFECDEDGVLVPVSTDVFAMRSQDLKPKFHDAGAFCGFPASRVLHSRGAGDFARFTAYFLPRHKVSDIDSEEDWELAETLYLGRAALKKNERAP